MFMSILALLATMQAAPEAQRTPCRSDTNLVGTWRVVEARGQRWPDDHPVHKHVTPTHYVVIEWDQAASNTASRAHGGSYVVGAGTHTSTVLYGFGEAYGKVAGKPFRIEARCWTSGDEWHLEGEVPGFGALRERWVRVSPSR
jgi:hypothetical protein